MGYEGLKWTFWDSAGKLLPANSGDCALKTKSPLPTLCCYIVESGYWQRAIWAIAFIRVLKEYLIQLKVTLPRMRLVPSEPRCHHSALQRRMSYLGHRNKAALSVKCIGTA